MHAFEAAARWPSIWCWLAQVRTNALALFPDEAYERLRVDRSAVGRQLVVLSDPEAIAHVCGRASARYRLTNLHLRMLGPSSGSGLTVAQDKLWAAQRKLASRLMPRGHSDERVGHVQARIATTLDGWGALSTAGLPPQIAMERLTNMLVQLSIDLIAQTVFEYDRSVATPAVVAAVNAHRAQAERPDLLDALGLDPRVGSARMRRSYAISHALDYDIERAIADSAQQRGQRLPDTGRAGFSRDFVVSLISGFESVTTTTLWLLLICGVDPGLQARLRESLPAQVPNLVVAARDARPSLLDACLAETLRLYPPLPLVLRTATQDDETPAGNIRKGAMVCISPWIVQRHRKLWREPERFEPERHLRGDAELQAFMPFGVGMRRCIGMHVGNHLVKAIVSQTLQRFEVLTVGDRMPRPQAGMSLRPASGFELCLRERC